ncbi:MAG: thymidylate synthase [Chloroflexota bacterium]|nr:MAG: thymidylate synthase [Chloroflexota bacterium]
MTNEFENHLTSSSESLSPEEAERIAPYFSNSGRSVVALMNLPEVVKGALFSRYSRSSKGVRRLFLDEFFGRVQTSEILAISEVSTAEARAKAEAFYTRILSDYGDDSVGELGGAHIAFQEVSQIAAKTIEDHRIGLAFLEKSSRYVPFDDKVNGQYRYYRDSNLCESRYGEQVIQHLDGLFDSYAAMLPRMILYLEQTHPIDEIEFENALTGDVEKFARITDEEFRKSAAFAYKSAVRAQACDLLRCFLPMATLTNVGVWGNGRALEYMLLNLLADPFAENRWLGRAGAHELDAVIGPFIKRADDEKGKRLQEYLQGRRAVQRELEKKYLTTDGERRATEDGRRMTNDVETKVTLTRYDADALDAVVAAILFGAGEWEKCAVMTRVKELSEIEKAEIVRAYVGTRGNRRHKPGRAFEHARYEFDLLINIGEFRDLQRHRVVTPDRQAYTTVHGFETNEQINAVPEIRDAYNVNMERADKLFRAIADEYPNEAQYLIPYGYRVRYNIELNLRELYHWCELRTTEQGHPDYRLTSQQMYYAVREVHPLLVEGMTFVNLKPNPPMSRLRAEMRSAKKRMGNP